MQNGISNLGDSTITSTELSPTSSTLPSVSSSTSSPVISDPLVELVDLLKTWLPSLLQGMNLLNSQLALWREEQGKQLELIRAMMGLRR